MAIVIKWQRYLSIQPPLMLLIFALSVTGTILADITVYRTCTTLLGINQTECSILHQNGSSKEALRIDALVQPQVSLMSMSKSLIQSLLPAFLSFFVGPWSDKYGRKPLLLAGYIGQSITYCLLLLMTIWDINPWYFLIAYVPSACLGGFCIIILASFCYISDISVENDRAWHLAYLQISISFGFMLGIFTGPLVYKQYGYVSVFSLAAMCVVVAGLYVLLFVPETVQSTSRVMWTTLFDINHVKDLFSTCTKKRDGFDRCIVWCCMAYLVLNVLIMEGSISVAYLFSNARLGWDVGQFSTYMVANIGLGMIGTLIGVKIFGSLAGFSEICLAILASVSSLTGALVQAFTWLSWHMYLAVIISMFGDISGPALRAILSKSVPPSDTGKVFSLIVSMETIMPVGATSLYAMVFSHYLPPIYPSPVWLVSSILFFIMVILLICVQIRIIKTNTSQYRVLLQDSE
ncbi:hypothetical protein KPH14_012362 [Odynerus spinipes]|uniref:Proton-coupled folate transporter n=1 Tax=Odynerus spinipes TaxID=1348599 RepID=A0AAD9RHX2_9HYME|nr:hypothetical protein KPH14_012362 [Odynerus spinipes]